MTDEQIIRFLAEKVMGWSCVGFYDDTRLTSVPRLVEQHGKPDGQRDWYLIVNEDPNDPARKGRAWNPITSIADAFEVQAAIPEDNRYAYVLQLEAIFENDYHPAWSLANATARQRSIAAVRARGGDQR